MSEQVVGATPEVADHVDAVSPTAQSGDAMHIHRPKSVHHWREFLGEIGVIVIGVLIALTAEQFVDSLHWRERLHETRKQLQDEIAFDARDALAWISVSPCLDQQLAVLDQQLWAARRTGRFAGVTSRFSPPLTLFRTDAWLNARSLQVSDHLSSQEVRRFSDFYFFPAEMAGDVTTLHSEAADLEPLTRALEHVTPAEADELLARIGRARELQWRMETGAMLMVSEADRLGAPVALSQAQDDFRRSRKYFGSCVTDPGDDLNTLRAGGAGDAIRERLHFVKPALPQ